MPSPEDIVQHIVVLMLENRSFDHMLGYMKSQIPSLNGLDGTEWNPEDASNPVVKVQVSDDAGYLDLVADPSHWTPDVLDQIYSVYKCGTKPPGLPAIGPNMSFVANYSYRNNNSLPAAHKIMRCFAPDSLPALTTLAREFAVCDSWYSSIPGQTWPNRMFVHAATSDGHIDNKLYDYDVETIYQRLEEASRSWKIYFHDIPQTLALKRLRTDVFKDRFRLFHDFLADARNGSLPDYSFIEPRYYDFAFKRANDQHPNHDVSMGDVLIADVYEAVRNSPLWEQTLLVILWDEHGGIYDHAFPVEPRVPSPDGKVNRDINPPFNFDLLGVRVPAIMVSPYIAKSQVEHTQYEHASVPATLKKLFDLSDFLTERDRAASTFEEIISLDQPRTDTPAMLPRVPEAASLAARAAKLPFLLSAAQSRESEAAGVISQAPLSEFQQSLTDMAASFVPAEGLELAAEVPLSEHAAAEHVRRFASDYFALPDRTN